jgi:RsiW-degrading membrane proteinase PrsW (M82 family)
MTGVWISILLIVFSALPVMLVFVWFRLRLYPLSLPWFFLSILTGFFSLFIALFLQLLLQTVLPFDESTIPGAGGFWLPLLKNFIRIPLTEELSRFAAFALLFRFTSRFVSDKNKNTAAFGAASGLLAGLGFALFENISYNAQDTSLVIIRLLGASPLHAACGGRVGLSVMLFRDNPAAALASLLSAVIIHGMFNGMIINPVIPVIFPIILAITALASPISKIILFKDNNSINHGNSA